MTAVVDDAVRASAPARGGLPHARWGLPHLVAAALVLGAAVFCLAPPADPDVWWHLRAGRWILDHHALPTTDPWSLAAHGRAWMAHSWLAEVLLAGLHAAFGLKGLVLFRAAAVTTLLAALAVQAFRRTSPGRALLVLVLALLATRGGWGERPQLLSFLLLVPVAQLVRSALTGRRSIWWAVPLTYLWANLHGLWFLAPALVALGAVHAVAESTGTPTQRLRSARPYALAALACVVAAALTPNGPGLLLQPARVNGYGQFVTEWRPVDIHSPWGLGFFGMLLALLITYARSNRRATAYEVASVGFAVVLGLQYTRTVAPAAVLLVPLLADALGKREGSRRATFPPAVVQVTTAFLVVLAAVGGALVLTKEPDLPPSAPVAATAALERAAPGDQRVLNEYAVGGWLLEMAPDAHPAIDGRAEIYPTSYVADYIGALHMSGDWKATVEPLHANVALLHPDTPLVNGLRDELKWRIVYSDNDWLVLVPPTTAAGRSTT